MTREEFITQTEATQRAFRRFLAGLCCGDSAQADDLAQDSYVKAFMACDTLSDPDKFKPWLYRIGYTTFINHRRAMRPTDSYDAAGQMQAPERADETFRYQELYSALDRLPPNERSSILLFYLENYSVKEISGIIDASTDAVKQYLSRGRKHLRNILNMPQQ